MRAQNWNPKIADEQIYSNAMDRLEMAANRVAEKAEALCPVGTKSRPMYKTGKFAGKPWTARDAGALKKSIRVVRKYGDEHLNIWVIAGNKNVYYAHIVEFYTPFLRPALFGSRSEIQTVIKQGTMRGGPSYTAKGGTF